MSRINERPDTLAALYARLDRLEEAVRTLATAGRIGDTAIDNGKLVIRGGALVAEDVDGSVLFYVGQGTYGGNPNTGQGFIEFKRSNGKVFFNMYGGGADNQFWAFYDQSGSNIIFSDDATSGQGMARPYLPMHVQPSAYYFNMPTRVTSGDWTPVWTITGLKQHPRLRVFAQVNTDAGNTGQIRLRDTGPNQVIDGPINTAAGASFHTLTGQLPGGHMSYFKVDVEVRRASGTGAVAPLVLYTYGVQS